MSYLPSCKRSSARTVLLSQNVLVKTCVRFKPVKPVSKGLPIFLLFCSYCADEGHTKGEWKVILLRDYGNAKGIGR